MSQKKSISISCIVCVLVMIVAGGLLLLRGESRKRVVEPAASCDQLEVAVKWPTGEQTINIWQSESGVYYFFLPSGSEHYEISFANLDDDSTLQLDSVLFSSQNTIIENISYSKAYEMEFKQSEDGQVSETAQVVFMKSEGLPALFIDTASGNMEAVHTDKEAREEASVFLVGEDGKREYSGNIKYITARGNSTFDEVDKKSYLMRFNNDVDLLGMPKAEKWILLANAIDDTRIKNELIFQFAESYSNVPSIRGKYVDLYLNGEYAGNYYLCEKVEIGKNRLNITNLEEKTEAINFKSSYQNAVPYISEDGKIKATTGLNNPEDITGGYLLEHMFSDKFEVVDNAFMTDRGHCYEIISPSPATVEQAEYICNLFNEMETALVQEDGIHPVTGKHFSEYMDVDSWTSKYLMEEVFNDPDAIQASMYFYKDADSVDARIHSGPMWDYDRTMGSYGSVNTDLDIAHQVGCFGVYVEEMMSHQEVKEQVYDKLQDCMVPYVENLLQADVYRLSRSMQASLEMDKVRWPYWRGYYSDHRASCDHIVWFTKEKTDYLRELWLEGKDEYCTVTFLDYSGGVYAVYMVRKGEHLSEVPNIATYGAIFSGWYSVDYGKSFDIKLPILQDITYESRWIGMDLLLLNGAGMAGMDIMEIDPDILRDLADQLELLQQELASGEYAGGESE